MSFSGESGYWAEESQDNIAEAIEKQWAKYRSWLSASGYGQKIKSQYDTYYGLRAQGIKRDGNLHRINLNQFRNVIDHVAILVSQNKLNYEFSATNTDTESMEQMRLGREFVQYQLYENDLDSILARDLLTGLICDESYNLCDFNAHAGVDVAGDPETGEIQTSGKQRYESLTAFDVARNVFTPNAQHWNIVRLKRNKYDLAANYPDHRDAILSAQTQSFDELTALDNFAGKDEDHVYMLALFHDRTAVLPEGRQTFVINGIVLEDDVLQYDERPVKRFCPAEVIGTICGSGFAGDMVGPQQALTKLGTANLSNLLNLALTSVWSPEPLNFQTVAEGFRTVQSKQLPQPLNLGQSNPQTWQGMEYFANFIDKLGGVSDLVRGAAPQGVTAASGMALLLSQAIAFSSPISRRFASFAGSVADATVYNTRFLKEEIAIGIVGKANAGLAKKIGPKSFDRIKRVRATLANPLALTRQGQEQRAMEMMKSGMIKDIEKFILVSEGAPLETLVGPAYAKQTLLESENELLRAGIKPTPLVNDTHDEHIASHESLLNTQMMRDNPDLVRAVLDHIEEHEVLKVVRVQRQERIAQRAQAMLGMAQPPAAAAPPPMEGEQLPPEAGAPTPPAPAEGDRLADVSMPSLPKAVQNVPEAAVPYSQMQGAV